MSLIGLDIGTTGCKAIVFDAHGRILGQAAREYSVFMPHPQWAEQDAEEVWGLAWEALGEALLAGVGAGVYPDLKAAVARTVHLERRVEPQAESVAAYEARYQLYRQVYPTLRALQRQL